MFVAMPAARAAETPADPEAWAARLREMVAERPDDFAGGRFVGRIALATGGSGSFEPLTALSQAAWGKVSQADLALMASVAFSAKLNAFDARTLGAPVILALAQADAVLAFQPEGSVEVVEALRPDTAIATAVLARGTDSSGMPSAAALARVLADVLGYDGVILDDSGPLVLARTPNFAGSGELFAVAIEGSAGKARLAAGERQRGTMIMRLERSHGRFTTFRKLAARSAARLSFGTKLVIEHPSSPTASGAPTKAGAPPR